MTPALLRRVDRRFGVFLRQRKRLLAEDVLSGRGGGDHLRRVHRVRRREHDGIDHRIGQQRLVALGELDAAVRRRTTATSGVTVRVAPATKRISGAVRCTASTSVLPHQPKTDDRCSNHSLHR